MAEAQGQIDHGALNGGLEADALDFELLLEAVRNALEHVVHQGAGKSVHGAGLAGLAVAGNAHVGAVNHRGGEGGEIQLEFALRALGRDAVPCNGHLDLGGNRNGRFSNTRHTKNL